MKILLLTIFGIWSILSFGQEKLIYVEYDHGQFISTFSNKEILIAGKEKARYDVQELKEIHNHTEYVSGISKKMRKLDFTSIKPTTFYTSKNSNVIHFDDYLGDKQYFIKDTLPELKWELIPNESKEIQGYVSQKAKLKYRGSEFTAYYTPEIPTHFGPWKFSGLPGLILEITLDDDVTYYWKASKIVYPYKENVNFKFTPNNYKTSLRTFLSEKEKHKEEKQRIFDEKYAQGAVIIKSKGVPMGIEKVYEWEQQGN